eukprot:jgi/Botrbrau1/18593/Bobra.0367s0035.1
MMPSTSPRTGVVDLDNDMLLKVFAFLSMDERCHSLPLVCKAFYFALRLSGQLFGQLRMNLLTQRSMSLAMRSLELLGAEHWFRTRELHVHTLVLQLPDGWEGSCMRTVENILTLCDGSLVPTKLEVLKFYVQGRLPLWPRSLGRLRTLHSLEIIAESTFERIPSWISNLRELTQLHFDCRIDAGNVVLNKFFPIQILKLEKLCVLTLSHCERLVMSPQIGELPALATLNVSDAALNFHAHAFPPESFAARTLTHLELKNCRLEYFPFQVSNMSNLRTLSLTDNRLSSLPRLIGTKLARLEIIDLSNNAFKHIPSVLKNLRNLREINLSYNDDLEVADKDSQARDGGNSSPTMNASTRNVSLAQLVSNLSYLKTLDLTSRENKVWSAESMSQLLLVREAVANNHHWCHLQELKE